MNHILFFLGLVTDCHEVTWLKSYSYFCIVSCCHLVVLLLSLLYTRWSKGSKNCFIGLKQTSSFFGWKIILVQRARRCYGVQHYWAPWLLHDTKTWTFTSGIFSSFPVGAKFMRSLSHRDEAVCPHRNHIMWQNKNTTVSIEWEPQTTLFCSPGIDWLLGVRQAH